MRATGPGEKKTENCMLGELALKNYMPSERCGDLHSSDDDLGETLLLAPNANVCFAIRKAD